MPIDQLNDYDRFKIAVAYALARWQAVEIILQEFFVMAIESPDWRWSAAAYNAVFAFTAKLDMLHEILLWRLPSKDLVAEWTKLKQKLKDESYRRNRLVHWSFLATYTDANRETYTYISTPLGDARKSKTGKQLTEAGINEMGADFEDLYRALKDFLGRASPQLTSPKKPWSPHPD